jgi:hypothetical protein
MTSACLLHFSGNIATMVRWIEGPHVNAFLQYGSHASVTNNQTENVSTIVKQSKRGLTLIKDLLFIQSTLNAPLSPQGLVNVIHP